MGEHSFQNVGKDWGVVSRFTEAVIAEDRFLYELEHYCTTNTIEFIRLEYQKTYRAIVLPLTDLIVSFEQNQGDLVLEGISEISAEVANRLIFHSTIDDRTILSDLFIKQMYPSLPKHMGFYAGVHRSSGSSRTQPSPYEWFGITKPEGALKIRQRPDSELVFDLFKFPSSEQYVKKSLSNGALRKIPEGGDNLRRREEWFRRRFGRKE